MKLINQQCIFLSDAIPANKILSRNPRILNRFHSDSANYNFRYIDVFTTRQLLYRMLHLPINLFGYVQ